MRPKTNARAYRYMSGLTTETSQESDADREEGEKSWSTRRERTVIKML